MWIASAGNGFGQCSTVSDTKCISPADPTANGTCGTRGFCLRNEAGTMSCACCAIDLGLMMRRMRWMRCLMRGCWMISRVSAALSSVRLSWFCGRLFLQVGLSRLSDCFLLTWLPAFQLDVCSSPSHFATISPAWGVRLYPRSFP